MSNDFDDYCPACVSSTPEDVSGITVRSRMIYARDVEKMKDMPFEQKILCRDELIKNNMCFDPNKVVDIYSHGNFCAYRLSNFSKTDFIFEDINVKSMEGFLQSLKTPNEEEQIYICSLEGKEAKKAGLAVAGFDGEHLYWKGKMIDRFSEEYHTLVRRAYRARFEQDNLFRVALERSKDKELLHTIGNNDPKETILTVDEFIGFLRELQAEL